MKIALIILSIISWVNLSAQEDNFVYKGDPHVFVRLKANHEIVINIQSQVEESLSNESFDGFGEVHIVFSCDSNFSIKDVKQIHYVNPSLDSLCRKATSSLDSVQLQLLIPDQLYSFKINIGSKKELGTITGGWILLADGKYKKAIKVYKKCLEKSPNNSIVLYRLGYCMIKTDDPSGLHFINRAKNMGDIDAIEYLEE